jgi:hypothetical protein
VGLFGRFFQWLAGDQDDAKVGRANRQSSQSQTTRISTREPEAVARPSLAPRLSDPVEAAHAAGSRSTDSDHLAKSRGELRATIGLDFGTHSTKAVLRVRGEEGTGWVLRLAPDLEGYPHGATPSLVQVDSHSRFLVGEAALSGVGGCLHRFAKMRLMEEVETESSEGPSARVLVTAMLAHSLGVAMERARELRPATTLRFSANLPIPVDREKEVDAYRRFLHCLQAAWELAESGRWGEIQGGLASEVIQLIGDALARNRKAIPGAGRPFEVLMESLAPLVALSRDVRERKGLFLLVDVGAGTTDCAVTDLRPIQKEDAMSCLEERSTPSGARDLEAGDDEREAALKAIEALASGVEARGRRTEVGCSEEFRRRWYELTVLWLGGGTLREDVRVRVEAALRKRQMLVAPPRPVRRPGVLVTGFDDPNKFTFKRWGPSDLHLDGAPLDPATRSFYAVASGLAIERRRWPLYSMPSEIEPVAPVVREQVPQDYMFLDD